MFSKPSDSSYQPCEVLMRTTTDGKKAHAALEQEIPNVIAPSPYVVGYFKDLKNSNSKHNVNINKPKTWRVTWY